MGIIKEVKGLNVVGDRVSSRHDTLYHGNRGSWKRKRDNARSKKRPSFIQPYTNQIHTYEMYVYVF